MTLNRLPQKVEILFAPIMQEKTGRRQLRPHLLVLTTFFYAAQMSVLSRKVLLPAIMHAAGGGLLGCRSRVYPRNGFLRLVSTKSVGQLLVVATPLGNVADLTPRAHAALATAALVAAEDTRVTRAMLRRAGDTVDLARIISCHEHNHEERLAHVLSTLQSGGKVALVTDAGTPAISDPGAQIVAAAAAAGFAVSPIPGPCAAAAAMSVSGAVSPLGFIVLGFLPRAGPQRMRQLAHIASERVRPAVLYEAPHRIERTLADLAAACESAARGGTIMARSRRITVCREMTKEHEQVITFPSIAAAAARLVPADAARGGSGDGSGRGSSQPQAAAATAIDGTAIAAAIPVLGEFTLVIHADEKLLARAMEENASTPAGAVSDAESDAAQPSLAEALELLQDLRARMPGLKASDAVARVAAITGVRKKLLYGEVLAQEAAGDGAAGGSSKLPPARHRDARPPKPI